MAAYGMHLGNAFQLIDDALDYKANAEDLGKNLGDDLAEGKPTLPLIHAIEHANEGDAQIITDAIKEGDRNAFNDVYKIVQATGAIEYTEKRAEEEAQKAINALALIADSPYKQAMMQLAIFSVQRNY